MKDRTSKKGRAEKASGHFIQPMACLAVERLPLGPEWEYELKFDGYRAIGFKTSNRVHLMSRNGKDFSRRFPMLAGALEVLPDDTVIDGEVVAMDETGQPSFNLLQNHAGSEYSPVFYVFEQPERPISGCLASPEGVSSKPEKKAWFQSSGPARLLRNSGVRASFVPFSGWDRHRLFWRGQLQYKPAEQQSSAQSHTV